MLVSILDGAMLAGIVEQSPSRNMKLLITVHSAPAIWFGFRVMEFGLCPRAG